MKYKCDQLNIQLKFVDSLEAAQFLTSIFSYKHGSNILHDLGDVNLRNYEIYQLSHVIEELLEKQSVPSDFVVPKSFRIQKDSPTFQQVFINLKNSYYDSPKRQTWPSTKRSYARKWVQCYFAPCLIDDDLADYVIEELELISS